MSTPIPSGASTPNGVISPSPLSNPIASTADQKIDVNSIVEGLFALTTSAPTPEERLAAINAIPAVLASFKPTTPSTSTATSATAPTVSPSSWSQISWFSRIWRVLIFCWNAYVICKMLWYVVLLAFTVVFASLGLDPGMLSKAGEIAKSAADAGGVGQDMRQVRVEL